jgi:predicted permease
MTRTFVTLRDIDPGFSNPELIQTGRIWMPNPASRDAAQSTRVQHEILDKIAALPGVEAVGLTSLLPMEGEHSIAPVLIEAQLPVSGTPQGRMNKFVSPGYFDAMGTRVIAGRDITWSDIETGGRVVVISEELARELAPDPAGAIGKRVRTLFETDAWREVIGVVQSVRENGLYEDASSFIYWPVLAADIWGASVLGTPSAALAIRSERAGTASLAQEVRQAIRSVNGGVASTTECTMLDVYAGSLARTSFTLVMLVIAGGMALLLGVIGIYGVIAYVVSQRVREIGIRSALGAEPRRLERMFVLHGLKLCAAGAAIGLLVAAALGRSMSALLFGVAPTDPVAYAGAIVVTVAAVTLASYLPARRAAAVDPVDALRSE